MSRQTNRCMGNNLNSCREQADLKPWGQSRVPVSRWINILSGQRAGLWGLLSSRIRCPQGPGASGVHVLVSLVSSSTCPPPHMLLICTCVHLVPSYQFVSVMLLLSGKKKSISLCFIGGARQVVVSVYTMESRVILTLTLCSNSKHMLLVKWTQSGQGSLKVTVVYSMKELGAGHSFISAAMKA